jgi:chromate transport protein ChrA
MPGDQNGGAKSAAEVLRIFLKLGLTCFGGPIAHIGYFRDEFVLRRKWIDERAFADLVGLCQFLPGPASSQVGFSIGLMRAGYLGALAAWIGFTLPSAAILVLFAYGVGALSGPIGAGLLHGLKLTAVAIVAQAVWGMARNLCPDRERASIAVVAALIILFSMASIAQIGAIVLGGLAGLWLCRSDAPAPSGHVEIGVSRIVGFWGPIARRAPSGAPTSRARRAVRFPRRPGLLRHQRFRNCLLGRGADTRRFRHRPVQPHLSHLYPLHDVDLCGDGAVWCRSFRSDGATMAGELVHCRTHAGSALRRHVILVACD